MNITNVTVSGIIYLSLINVMLGDDAALDMSDLFTDLQRIPPHYTSLSYKYSTTVRQHFTKLTSITCNVEGKSRISRWWNKILDIVVACCTHIIWNIWHIKNIIDMRWWPMMRMSPRSGDTSQYSLWTLDWGNYCCFYHQKSEPTSKMQETHALMLKLCLLSLLPGVIIVLSMIPGDVEM